MDEAVRFDDLPPDEMVAFLSEAHQHGEFDPTATNSGTELVRLAPVWECKGCETEYPLEDVLVAQREPKCPHCEASGWQYVVPHGPQDA
jgi:hypothetical protein